MGGPLSDSAQLRIPKAITMPYQEGFLNGRASRVPVAHLLEIGSIQPAGEVLLPSLQVDNVCWLRRIHDHLRVRVLELRKLRHANGYFWNDEIKTQLR